MDQEQLEKDAQAAYAVAINVWQGMNGAPWEKIHPESKQQWIEFSKQLRESWGAKQWEPGREFI